MRRLLVSLLMLVVFTLNQPAWAAKTEKITVTPLFAEGVTSDTFGLVDMIDVFKNRLLESGYFEVITPKEIAEAAEFGIDPLAMKTNLTVEYFTERRGLETILVFSLKNKGDKELNWVRVPVAEVAETAVLIKALVELLPILQAQATCQSWQEHITTDQSLPMQEAMGELSFRLLGCNLVSASERESPYLKYATHKYQAAAVGLMTAGFSSMIVAAGGWCWVGGAPEDVAGYVLGGVFTAATIATLAAGIPIAVKYHRGKNERMYLDQKPPRVSMQMTPVFSAKYQGLQLALTW